MNANEAINSTINGARYLFMLSQILDYFALNYSEQNYSEVQKLLLHINFYTCTFTLGILLRSTLLQKYS